MLDEERKKNAEVQRELDLQVFKKPHFFSKMVATKYTVEIVGKLPSILQISLKAEMEVAMKLLEKDIHDKQDTIISLRRQLDDIKLINLEMYKKLQVSHIKH